MAGAADAYSRLVAWLKILLPIAALAILSTLFLLSRSIDPTRAIPFSQVDVDELLADPRITAPNYAGVTDDGTALGFSAATARPDPADPGHASAIGLRATIDTPDGVSSRITADQGTIDGSAGRISLSGNVRFENSLGYHVQTTGINFATGHTGLQTTGAVSASGPLGHLTAGEMQLQPSDDGVGYVLVFNGGVKLLYDPQD